MSLRFKLALLLAAVVSATVFLAWLVTGRAVIGPFAREVLDVYLDQAVFVSERIANGEDREKLEKELGIEIKLREKPALKRKHNCDRTERRGHEIIFCRGPRAPVSVRTEIGWITLRRDLDVARPRERITQFLLLVLLAVIGASAWVAVIVTRPLRTTQEAIARVAEGELKTRLPEKGPKELRDMATAFNRMTERVDQMLQSERTLMAGISHELRTPLARLRLELELLREQGVAEKRAGAMEKDVEEIDQLIGELLESSRLSIGERTIAKTTVDLRRVVEEAAQRAQIADLQIYGEAAPVEGDHDRLVRVIANLLTNASKYAPGSIEVALAGKTIEVRDRGPGVAAIDLPRLFEPFYRASGAPSTGLGLGLSIARQVVTLHGGTIQAENREGGGLVVRIALP